MSKPKPTALGCGIPGVSAPAQRTVCPRYAPEAYSEWIKGLTPGSSVAAVRTRIQEGVATRDRAEIWLLTAKAADELYFSPLHEFHPEPTQWERTLCVPLTGARAYHPRMSLFERTKMWWQNESWTVEPLTEELRAWVMRKRMAHQLARITPKQWAQTQLLSQLYNLALPLITESERDEPPS